jgi:DNA modification methylase
MGTGTTLLAADVLGRSAIGVDLSADYCRLATWRCNDPAERAKALQVPKPPPIPDGMETLF